MSDDAYVNIRNDDFLGPIIGERVVDVTQHDKEEFDTDGQSYVALHFSNGYTVRFYVGDSVGFAISPPDADEERFGV